MDLHVTKYVTDTRPSMTQSKFKSLVKSCLRADRSDPFSKIFRNVHRRYRVISNKRRFAGKTSRDVFTEIYTKGYWGKGKDIDQFYSGSGSHEIGITKPYVNALQSVFSHLGKPDVVDIGCGDFAVGSQLRKYCGGYVAGDIVESLIARNSTMYEDLDIDFRVIDIANDPIPKSTVLVVRQVFQHMSNADILDSISNIAGSCKYMIVTEHLPLDKEFPHNLEKSAGPDIRLYANTPSGVVLTSPPFNLDPIESKVICEVSTDDGVCPSLIQTIMYKMPAVTN